MNKAAICGNWEALKETITIMMVKSENGEEGSKWKRETLRIHKMQDLGFCEAMLALLPGQNGGPVTGQPVTVQPLL